VRTKSFHSLRHTFVSRLANADVSADVRKALAGHDTDEAHARYTHLAFTKQTEALAKLSAIGGWR
jgi:integrase